MRARVRRLKPATRRTGNRVTLPDVLIPNLAASMAPKPDKAATTTARICEAEETDPRTSSGDGMACTSVADVKKKVKNTKKQKQILTDQVIQDVKFGVITSSPSERKGFRAQLLRCHRNVINLTVWLNSAFSE